jgi:hypothetical protein
MVPARGIWLQILSPARERQTRPGLLLREVTYTSACLPQLATGREAIQLVSKRPALAQRPFALLPLQPRYTQWRASAFNMPALTQPRRCIRRRG